MFQSLLSWISLIGPHHPSRQVHGHHVSILVVVDQPHRLLALSTVLAAEIGFQSLLSWISLIGARASVSSPRASSRFNPCCRGSASSASSAWISRRSSECFNPCCRGSASSALPGGFPRVEPHDVSILVVVDQPHRRDEPDRLRDALGRVSILVVVDQPHRLSWRVQLQARQAVSFNPCCRGSASSARDCST